MKFEHIFFDLDGTLTDSQDGILNSFKNVFIHFGLEIPDYQTLCTYIGPPLPFTFAEILGFSKEKTEESIKVFRNYYNERGYLENRVYQGIPQLLAALKANGFKLSVAFFEKPVTIADLKQSKRFHSRQSALKQAKRSYLRKRFFHEQYFPIMGEDGGDRVRTDVNISVNNRRNTRSKLFGKMF